METPKPTDVLICGAGAAGLTLAIDLARRGIAFRIIDKLDGPFAGSRGKGIQPRTQEMLEDLGVLDRIVAVGGVYPPHRDYLADGSIAERPVMDVAAPTPAEPYHIPLLVPQYLTEQVLRDRLAELSGMVEFGHELVAFDQDHDGVTAQIRGPQGDETIRTRFLVGTDGGRSAVRRALDIAFPGKTLGVRAVVADISVRGLDRDAWHRWNEGDMAEQISLCPMPGNALFQLQAPVSLEGEIDISAEGLSQMLEARTGRQDISVRDVAWGSIYSMNARLADRYQIGRVLIAGDAAHIHPPTGGQGLNTSIQDAYNLGWKLAGVLGGAPMALLESYEQERRPIAAEMLGLSTRLLDEAKAGSMRRGREVQQLDLSYRGSPLAFEHPKRSSGVHAGDRAPDAPLMGAAGQPVRLFELLKGPHWTAIGYDTDNASSPPARANLRIHRVSINGDLRDRDGHFVDAYQPTPGGWTIIRPDGYVGASVDAAARGDLLAYLTRNGLSG